MKRLARVLLVAALGLGGVRAWTHHGQGDQAPRIGLSLSEDWYDRSELNPAATGLALSRAGAVVRNLHPSDLPRLDGLLDGLDGIVLVGGMDDVDPALYGGDASKAHLVQRERDDFEIELLKRAERRGLPVLGICRGAQLLTVAYGGTLRRLEGEQAARHGLSASSLAAHDVLPEPGSRLRSLLGGAAFPASSTHFQGIAEAGPRLRVAARAEDGLIEAVELPGPRFVVGLQWHPEWEPFGGERSLAPFRALVAASTK
jgi:putative glutamine amidotransferase